jgi:hypothetical protein
MIKNKKALIIGTEVAVNGFESGASLRLNAIKKTLEDKGYSTKIASRSNAKSCLGDSWDVIALTSFATAKFARKARKSAPILWFDSTDSWSQTRVSLIRQGHLRQFLAYARDLYFIWTAPHFDLVTFISARDRDAEKIWWRFRTKPFIFAISNLDQKLKVSENHRLVFVGDGEYLPNKHAISFLGDMASKMSLGVPIHVFGRGFESSDTRFIFHGYVPTDLIYETSDIYLAPIFSGAGVKLKVAIPAWNGLRVVTTTEGANGLIELTNLAVAHSPLEFFEKIKSFLAEPAVVKCIAPRETIFEVDESFLVYERISDLALE